MARGDHKVGIIGYGAYIPRYRIRGEEIAKAWGQEHRKLPIKEKSVPNIDEDSLTIAVEASCYAIKMANIDSSEIGAVYVGSESPPYAVKPSATVLAEALGITPELIAIDMEFACRAGTTALQSVAALVASGYIRYGLAVGTDTAQGRPSDELEYTAASGAAAFVLSEKSEETVAYIEDSYSYVTDTPDFWRRDTKRYPMHAFRFTGKPAYFKHIYNAVKGLLNKTGLTIDDFNYVVFHQPNEKFPIRMAKMLGVSYDKLKTGLLSPYIGNTYAAASLIGLCAVLDKAKPGERILVASFGSGAGSDALSIITQDSLVEKRNRRPDIYTFINRKTYIDYSTYLRYTHSITMR